MNNEELALMKLLTTGIMMGMLVSGLLLSPFVSGLPFINKVFAQKEAADRTSQTGSFDGKRS